jgi:hypothetical protein
MRNIKFRVWDVKAHKWMPQDKFAIVARGKGGVEVLTFDGRDGRWHPQEGVPLTVMQFTTVKDKKGKDLYEGDIVKKGESLGIVIFNAEVAEFWIRIKGDEDGECVDSEWEIIGNIYETPGLLL